MEYLGLVNAEGGPLLIVDAAVASLWTGIEGSDYERACAIFDEDPKLEGSEIDLGPDKGIVWEMKGAGTAFVFKLADSHLVIVRIWSASSVPSNLEAVIAEQPFRPLLCIGHLSINSEILTILWAPEEGAGIELADKVSQRRQKKTTAIEDSGLILRVRYKSYDCFHDEVTVPAGIGRRLHLIANI